MRKMFNEMIEIQSDLDCNTCGPDIILLEILKNIRNLNFKLLKDTNLKILQFSFNEEDIGKNIILILNNTETLLFSEIKKLQSQYTCIDLTELNTDQVLGYLNHKRQYIIFEN